MQHSRAAVLKRTYFGLNLLSFCFNWDNYALLPVLYPRITSPHFANDSAVTYGWVGASFAIAAVLLLPLTVYAQSLMELIFLHVEDPRYGSLLASIVLFGLPTVILGMISPSVKVI